MELPENIADQIINDWSKSQMNPPTLKTRIMEALEQAVREERERCARVAESIVSYSEQIPCPDENPGCCVMHSRPSTKHLHWREIASAIRQGEERREG